MDFMYYLQLLNLREFSHLNSSFEEQETIARVKLSLVNGALHEVEIVKIIILPIILTKI